jgi:sterol 3beta-glucosyltransferase
MKVTILTYGSQGDVEPFIALSQGFLQAGHDVSLAGPECYRNLIGELRLRFIGLPGNPRQLVQDLVDGAGSSRWRTVRSVSSFVLPLAIAVMEKSREAAAGADVIIHSFLFTSTGFELGRELGIPDISAQLFPVFSTTAAFPAPIFPDLPFGGIYRRFTHRLVSLIFHQGSRILYARIRKNHPVLSPLTGWPFDPKNARRTPILYGFSPRVIPKPRDWPEETHITGYWFPEHSSWKPDSGLIEFLEAGPPPVAIAFGSTVSRDLESILDKILEALALCSQRGIIIGGRKRIGLSNVHQSDYIPYHWLFQRSAVVIHHGGAGTTGRGLECGVPNIVLPFTSDQPFWGGRIYALGAGPKPLSPRRATAGELAQMITAALSDKDMRRQAAILGKGIREENGVSNAVRIVEDHSQQFSRGCRSGLRAGKGSALSYPF